MDEDIDGEFCTSRKEGAFWQIRSLAHNLWQEKAGTERDEALRAVAEYDARARRRVANEERRLGRPLSDAEVGRRASKEG